MRIRIGNRTVPQVGPRPLFVRTPISVPSPDKLSRVLYGIEIVELRLLFRADVRNRQTGRIVRIVLGKRIAVDIVERSPRHSIIKTSLGYGYGVFAAVLI